VDKQALTGSDPLILIGWDEQKIRIDSSKKIASIKKQVSVFIRRPAES
jgi:hypothetical protein